MLILVYQQEKKLLYLKEKVLFQQFQVFHHGYKEKFASKKKKVVLTLPRGKHLGGDTTSVSFLCHRESFLPCDVL